MRKKKTEEIPMDHPLEKLFGIEPLSTLVPVTTSETEIIPTALFDDKDKEIEGEIQEVYRLALDGYDAQVLDIEKIEPKYRSRANEVAIQYLNTALSASQQKMNLKKHRDLLSSKIMKSGDTNVTNNNLICDRNQLIQMMLRGENSE